MTPSSERPEACEFPPRCAARYAPVKLLGEGGSGRVWLAREVGLDRAVAVKLLNRASRVDAEMVARFLNEARITAALRHPSIVVVYDHDLEETIPWIAYEYVDGSSLRDLLGRAGALKPDDALEIAIQVASALELAHSRGVIHRDVKPENVLRAGQNLYKITDFGVAKWSGATGVQTAAGVVIGTPAYLAPELIRGDSPSGQSDIYAMGVMLFELLTGQLPFPGGSVVETLRRQLEDEPDLPSCRMPGIGPRFDRVVGNCLAKELPRRYPSVTALLHDLEEIVARPGTRAPAPGPDETLLAGSPDAQRAPRTRPERNATLSLGPIRGEESAPAGRPVPATTRVPSRQEWRPATRRTAAIALVALAAVATAAWSIRRPPSGPGNPRPASTAPGPSPAGADSRYWFSQGYSARVCEALVSLRKRVRARNAQYGAMTHATAFLSMHEEVPRARKLLAEESADLEKVTRMLEFLPRTPITDDEVRIDILRSRAALTALRLMDWHRVRLLGVFIAAMEDELKVDSMGMEGPLSRIASPFLDRADVAYVRDCLVAALELLRDIGDNRRTFDIDLWPLMDDVGEIAHRVTCMPFKPGARELCGDEADRFLMALKTLPGPAGPLLGSLTLAVWDRRDYGYGRRRILERDKVLVDRLNALAVQFPRFEDGLRRLRKAVDKGFDGWAGEWKRAP